MSGLGWLLWGLGGVVIAAVVVGLIRVRQNRVLEAVCLELSLAGERMLLGPERASYRGCTEKVAWNKSDAGVLVLTERRLLYRGLTGDQVELPLPSLIQITTDKWFLGRYRGGRMHLIVHTTSGNQLGFHVPDWEQWKARLESVIAQADALPE